MTDNVGKKRHNLPFWYFDPTGAAWVRPLVSSRKLNCFDIFFPFYLLKAGENKTDLGIVLQDVAECRGRACLS